MSFVANTDRDREAMLRMIGVSSIEELFEPVPASLRLDRELDVGPALSEAEAFEHLAALAARNVPASARASFLGGGVTRHLSPSVVRHLLLRPEFYTAYTPYQAEVSQGTLQVIFEFQTMIARLTGMEVANASLYDGGSALAEAMLMAFGIGRRKRRRFLVSRGVNPRYRRVLNSYARGQDLEFEEVPLSGDGRTDLDLLAGSLDESVAAVVLAQPNYLGVLEDARALAEVARERGALVLVSVDPISLALVEPPGAYGADVVTGEGQCLGIPLGFGGPLLGLMATRMRYVRHLPGRLVSLARDQDGKRGYVLTLQTREQHIRREKATSNICTNQSLMALAATLHLAALGESGFGDLARACLAKSHYLSARLKEAGVPRLHASPFVREFTVRVPGPAGAFLGRLRARGIDGGISLEEDYPELGPGAVLVSVTEANRRAEMDDYAGVAGDLVQRPQEAMRGE